MSYVAESEQHGDYLLEIVQDEGSTFSPRDWDNLTIIRGWHRRYDIGDGPNIDTDAYDSFADMIAAMIEQHGPLALIAPLYWYEHSGVLCKMGAPVNLAGTPSMDAKSLAAFRAQVMDDAGWDSGVAGLVMVPAARIAELGVDPDPANVEQQARNEVAEYSSYIEGNVWGYVISRLVTCDHGDTHKDVLESAWGFIGDIKESGVLDEAHAALKTLDS